MASALAVKRRHEGRLLAVPDVVGVALGKKDGRDCILVYVRRETARIRRAIPEALEEIPVDIVVSGDFAAR